MLNINEGANMCYFEHQPAMKLFSAMDRMRRAWRDTTPCQQISKAQFATLIVIAHGADPCTMTKQTEIISPMPLSVLASLQKQSLPAISQRIHTLEEMGYVKRVANPQDRRVSAVELTEKGELLLNETHKIWKDKMQTVLAAMSEQELKILLDLMEKMTQALEQAQIQE